MKKILSFLLALSMVLSCVPMPILAEEVTCDHSYVDGICSTCGEATPKDNVTALSEEDAVSSNSLEVNAPVINSVTVDKTQITAGESVTVTMDVTDESELAEVYVTFDTPNEGVANMIQVTLSLQEDGLYRGTLTTDSSYASGTYYAYYIVAQDIHGNRNQINTDRSVCFELLSERTETNAPVINSVSVDKTKIVAGESVTVTMDVTDESELAQVYVSFEMPFAGVVKRIDVPLSKEEDGLYRGTLTTDDTYPCGTYYAYYIVAEDIYGNREQINSDKSVCFEMISSGVETNAPVINSITLDKAQVVAGETVTITVDVTDESELTDVYVYFDTPIAGGGTELLVKLTLDEDGLYKGLLVTDETSANGNYYVFACVAKDVYGNRTQVKDKSACFDLTGGYEDTEAPVIKGIMLDKNEVAAGETVTITVDVEDASDLSEAYVYFDTPIAGGGTELLVKLTLDKDGLYKGILVTDATSANGNYYVFACVAKDVYGNRTQVKDKSACFELTGGHTEVNAPVINAITLDKSKVCIGEKVTITVDVTDESDLSEAYVYFDTPIAGGGTELLVKLMLDEDGLYKGTLVTDETFANGNYYVFACVAKDVYGNRAQVKDETACFEFGVAKIETNAPVIHSVTVDKPQVVIGESVTVTMEVTDESELDQLYVEFDTPHAGVVKRIHVDLTQDEDGLYRGTLTTDDTYPCGTYYAYYIVAQDVLGNRAQINSDTSVTFNVVCRPEEHIWDEGAVTKEPTEEETGICTYTCTVCGKTKTEEIPALNHTHKFGDDGKCSCGLICGICGDNLTWIYDPGSKTLIISGTGTMWDFDVDETPWYAYREEIQQLTVEEGVESIGGEAFWGCSAVTSIALPEGLLSIGDNSFMGCISLREIKLPETLTSLGEQAFFQCFNLEEIYIPASVTQIGDIPFGICESLTGITVDPANQYYCSDENGFLFSKDKTVLYQVLSSISGSYAVPDCVTTINRLAFDSCINLTELIIPDSVTKIGEAAFGDCVGLKKIQLPSKLERIEWGLFIRCLALESITIPASVKSFNNQVFADIDVNNGALSEIIFEGSAPRMPEFALEGATATAYYPAYDPTWTDEVMQNYGGTITWVPYGDAHEHTEVIDVAVAPTCTTTGLTEGKHCSVCGEVIVAQEVVPAKGHNVILMDSEEPTCELNGFEYYACEYCGGKEYTILLEATGHDYQDGTCNNCGCKDPNYVKPNKPSWDNMWDWIFGGWWGNQEKCDHSYISVVTVPTCTDKGYTTHTCTKCSDSYKDSYTSALGHAWDDGNVTEEATCIKDGIKTYTCETCGQQKTETIKATGHDYEDGVCGDCGAGEPTTPTEPTNPSWSNMWDWIFSCWWK